MNSYELWWGNRWRNNSYIVSPGVDGAVFGGEACGTTSAARTGGEAAHWASATSRGQRTEGWDAANTTEPEASQLQHCLIGDIYLGDKAHAWQHGPDTAQLEHETQYRCSSGVRWENCTSMQTWTNYLWSSDRPLSTLLVSWRGTEQTHLSGSFRSFFLEHKTGRHATTYHFSLLISITTTATAVVIRLSQFRGISPH